MTERQGVEIDYCPTCRGVWLDRGELDKLIEASAGASPTVQNTPPQPSRFQEPPRDRGYEDRSYSGHDRIHDSDDPSYKYGKKRKKGGFLGDLFDF